MKNTALVCLIKQLYLHQTRNVEICVAVSGQFFLRDAHARNHGSCIYQRGLDMCFDENNYNDFLQACLIERCAYSESWLL